MVNSGRPMGYTSSVMTPARIASIIIVAVVLLAGLTAFYFGGRQAPDSTPLPPARTPEVSQMRPSDQQLELMTILGDLVFRSDLASQDGRFREARVPDVSGMSAAEREELSKLMTLPYLQGSTEAGDIENVAVYDTKSAFNGKNVYASGHKAEAFVMDMDGNVLHKWQYDIADVWPEVPHTVHSTFWRRVYAYPNGDLLAIYEGIGLIKLDRHSRLLWSHRAGAHHEVTVAEDGRIYVLARQARIVPNISTEEPVLPDYIDILSADGEPLHRYSVIDAFAGSNFGGLLNKTRPKGDILHTNSLKLFDGSLAHLAPLFKKGNVMVSCLKIDTIAIIDLEENEVVWAAAGTPQAPWRFQHDPTLLPNGNILLFDNLGPGEDRSKVLEYDIRQAKIVWQYEGEAHEGLYSRTCGTSQRLPNGNTLITESDNGRAIEISGDDEIVWEFYNPHRAGSNQELVATLFEVKRVSDDYFTWLAAD